MYRLIARACLSWVVGRKNNRNPIGSTMVWAVAQV
jgi:hypothetical protein